MIAAPLAVRGRAVVRKSQRMKAAKGKAGRAVFWILKSVRAPIAARAPSLIVAAANGRRSKSIGGHRPRRRRGRIVSTANRPPRTAETTSSNFYARIHRSA